jgi:ketosteroid isomerase-like protein
MNPQGIVSDLIRKYYAAYEQKDRKAIEPLLTEDFSFTSPQDDHIDRAAYFNRCWPNCEGIRAFHIEKLFEHGNEAFVLYERESKVGATIRNTEFFRTRENKIREVEVYFGGPIGTV